jgi:tellurite resistance protein TerC
LAADPGPVHHVIRWGKRVVIAIIGGLVVAVGVMMIVLPGPAFVVIPLGLGILSLEFERPRVWLVQMREYIARTAEKVKTKSRRKPPPA